MQLIKDANLRKMLKMWEKRDNLLDIIAKIDLCLSHLQHLWLEKIAMWKSLLSVCSKQKERVSTTQIHLDSLLNHYRRNNDVRKLSDYCNVFTAWVRKLWNFYSLSFPLLHLSWTMMWANHLSLDAFEFLIESTKTSLLDTFKCQ